ncbi:MAG: ferrochelatase [Sphingomonadaceae bacterium]|nr:ferrochelatase [Sphingomonadaceae bacterium]MDW8415146.1 ferrochelatase [Thermaurantiacus sp.]
MAGPRATDRRRRRRLAWVAGAVLGAGFAGLLLFLMNQPRGWPFHWDAWEAVRDQPPGTRAQGRTGVVVVALLQPSRFDTAFTENFIAKLFDVAVPWPINRIALRDRGVALIDPTRPDATQPFVPRVLMAFDGRTVDWDGIPFVEKHRRGLVEWVPPSERTAGDVGTFLYRGRKGGSPSPAQRAMLKARALYYPRLPGGYLPQRDQTLAMIAAARRQLLAHPQVVDVAVFDAFAPLQAERALVALLDQRLDTLVLASALPIHSAFEEYRAAYPRVKAIVDAWARRTGRPAPRLVFAPQMADLEAYAAFWARHLAAVAPPPPSPGAGATLVVTLHGLPVAQRRRDPWVENSGRAATLLAPALADVLRARAWARLTVVTAQEAFADRAEDPANQLRSVREAFEEAARRGDALAIAVPVEFLAENTDTIFLHSLLMFEGLEGYRRFMGPLADVDWRRPWVRRFRLGPTQVVFAGTPGGDRQAEAGAVLAEAIGRVLAPVPPPPPARPDATGGRPAPAASAPTARQTAVPATP